MATLAVWRRSTIPTAAPPSEEGAMVHRPKESVNLDIPDLSGHARMPRRAIETPALLLGRGIFGGYFLYAGIKHFRKLDMMTGYSASKGIPLPQAAVIGSVPSSCWAGSACFWESSPGWARA